MATEIERKYLVVGDGWTSTVESASELDQGYLGTSSSTTVRIRVSEGGAYMTVKGPSVGPARLEFEYPIPAEDAEEMLSSLAVSRIVKRRSVLSRGPGVWTVDEFRGPNTGLVMLEIESGNDDLALTDEWIGLDVTEDSRFYNAYLSEHPISVWPASDLARFGLTSS